MTQSPEYPDLLWMPPKSWTNANRSSVQLIVIHTTEGSARGTSAEDGASYDQRRTDGTSTHYFHDSNSTVQCVRTEDQAHAARTQGNRRGIQHELCTVAGQADWGDAYHQAMLRLAAKQAARDAQKWNIPVRHLTVDQVAAGAPGFCGHYDITRAFPQDNGTHTDPGSNFPWTQFLSLVRQSIEGVDMSAGIDAADVKVIVSEFRNTGGKGILSDTERGFIAKEVAKELAPQFLAVLNGADADETAIIAGVLAGLTTERLGQAITAAGLTPQAIADALPDGVARDLADILAARLAS